VCDEAVCATLNKRNTDLLLTVNNAAPLLLLLLLLLPAPARSTL